MTSEYYIAAATKVLMKCAANDLWFPQGGEAVIYAWAEVFADSGLSTEDLIAGVARAYKLAGDDGYKPLPGSIIKHARDAYFEQLRSLDDRTRQALDEFVFALQDAGLIPPDAHRYARRVILGREPHIQLTSEQQVQIVSRIGAENLSLVDRRRRGIGGAA